MDIGAVSGDCGVDNCGWNDSYDDMDSELDAKIAALAIVLVYQNHHINSKESSFKNKFSMGEIGLSHPVDIDFIPPESDNSRSEDARRDSERSGCEVYTDSTGFTTVYINGEAVV